MKKETSWIEAINGQSVEDRSIPELEFCELRHALMNAVRDGQRVSALFAHVPAGEEAPVITAVLADDAEGRLGILRARVPGNRYYSLTQDCPQVHLFEREMAEQFGLSPSGHPWLKPVRFHKPYHHAAETPVTTDHDPAIGVTDFYRIEGEEVHEVAVGPVHAGIIEPGHFRFQCHGEEVFHLEISLGYQHRGVERALVGGPDRRSIHYAETLAGDTTIGHATAYCQAVEGLTGSRVPPRAHVLRSVALELERLANHTGDLGALANDVGFLPTASYCGRLRGDFLNMTAQLCGNRFGRGLIRPGGVAFDVDEALVADLQSRLQATMADLTVAANLLWETPSVVTRFDDTGVVTPETCEAIGLVGPAARACGAQRDVRRDHPWGIYRFSQIPVSTWQDGDVFARAYVRWLEVQHSARFIAEQLDALPMGPIRSDVGPLAPNRIVASLIEGWRGEICHVALTDSNGRFERYKVVDPSFHNWTGLAMALRDQQISDFPLCNKSFNLSYCGYDL